MDNITDNKKKKTVSLYVTIIIAIVVLISGIGIGALIGVATQKLSDDQKKILEEYRILKEEWLYGNEIEYLGDEAAGAILNGLSFDDPYTFYTRTEEEQGLSTSSYGFGIQHRFYGNSIYVIEVHNGTSKNLLFEGDKIYGCQIDGGDLISFTTQEKATNTLSNPDYNDSTFTFHLKRIVEGSEKNITVDIKKGDYKLNLVSLIETPVEDNNFTLSIKVGTFLSNPSIQLANLITTFYQTSKINKLVLDLRGNVGGYVSEAVNMAKLFVKKGTFIYSLVDKNNKVVEQAYQKDNPLFSFSNISVILDSNSASASELFALALRSNPNTTIYGIKSYGKGIAQSFHKFSDGSVVRYTFAYVYGPRRESEIEDNIDKVCIHNKGITPDIPFSIDYSYLIRYKDYSNVLGVSENEQKQFLQNINYIDDNHYPNSYSASYHFVDAVKAYCLANNVNPFNDDGTLTNDFSNLYAKDTCDLYIRFVNQLYNEVINAR